jgi:hypothetical protein
MVKKKSSIVKLLVGECLMSTVLSRTAPASCSYRRPRGDRLWMLCRSWRSAGRRRSQILRQPYRHRPLCSGHPPPTATLVSLFFNQASACTVPDKRCRILEVVIVRHLITWVLGIWRGEGLGKGLGKGRSVYKQPETKMDGSSKLGGFPSK